MTTFSLLSALIVLTSPVLSGTGQCRLVKGDLMFAVSETSSHYVVDEYGGQQTSTSRNRNISDRKSRLYALDAIGTYILFKDWAAGSGLDGRYFQTFADATSLHYNADVAGFSNEPVTERGVHFTRWKCVKADYNIRSATYQNPGDLQTMLSGSYARHKDDVSAALLYEHDPSVGRYLALQRDFQTLCASVPSQLRQMRSAGDAFIQSLYAEAESPSVSVGLVGPFSQFALCDMVTMAPVGAKNSYFQKWKKGLGDSLWEDVLAFCAKNCATPLPDGPSPCEVVAAFPGCINPFLMRTATYEPGFDKGAEAYSNSDFAGAVAALSESLNVDGISTRALNLLGGAYRLNGQPQNALPFLLLCAAIEPSTQYLCGNLALCLSALHYSRLNEVCKALEQFAKDSWSINQINSL